MQTSDTTYNKPLKDEIIERLETLPGLLKNNEEAMLAAQDQLDETEFKIKIIENNVKQQVIDEVEYQEGKDKPVKKFSNETQRELALQTRINDHEEHSQLSKNKSKLQKEIKEMQIGHNFLERKFKAAKEIAELIKEEV